MADVTNYFYLALLISLQYLGLNKDSYQVTIVFTDLEEIHQPSIKADLTKVKDLENKWMITSKDGKLNLPILVTKNSVVDYERETTNVFDFNNINLDRLTTQKDTVFTKKNKALITVSKKDGTVEYKTLNNSGYDRIILSFIDK